MARHRRGVRPLPQAEAALRLRGPLLQPQCRGQGEGQCRREGRLHQEALLRACPHDRRPPRDFNHAPQDAIDSYSEWEQVHYEKGTAWAGPSRPTGVTSAPSGQALDVVKWESGKTDGYGRITLDGRHRHLASPELADTALVVGVRAFEVEIDASDGTPLCGPT